MNKIKSFFSKLKDRLYSAVKRYPIAVFLLLFAAAMAMVAIDINSNSRNLDDELFIRLAMSALYGAVLSLVIKSAAERFAFNKPAEWLSYLLVPASMALVFYLLIPHFDSMEATVRYALLLVLTAALFFFIPFIKSEKSASYFAQKVFLRLAVTMVYYGIITGGVEAIIFAVENLLSVSMPDEIYQQTAVCLAGLFIPSFFFAGIPDAGDEQTSYPKLLKILLHYIAYPLLAAYTLVLYAYFIKILIEWQLPSNLLGSLVIYYSLISVAALYFGHFTKDESRWTRVFWRFYPYALILPTLMMALSFAVRINQYGFTVPRYYAVLCVVFVLCSAGIIKLLKKIRVIPLAMAVLLLVSIFGPLSSFNVSKWNQNRRFERILTDAGMLEGGRIVPDPDADDETKHELSQIVAYFDSNHSTADLKYIDSDFERSEMGDVFGFESFYINKYPKSESYYLFGDYEKYRIIEVADYDYFTEVYSRGEKLSFESGGRQFEIIAQDGGDYELMISVDGAEIYSISMLDVLMPMFEAFSGRDEPGEYVFADETDAVSIKMIILSADYEKEGFGLYYDIRLLFSVK